MITVGVDPGLDGALVSLDNLGRIWHCCDMPTITVNGKRRVNAGALVYLFADIGPVDLVAVEDVQGVQGSGATSAFTFGRGVGVIEGVLAALARPVIYIRPQVWTKAYGGADKGAHRQAAQRLWPDRAELFSRVKDDGRADAALLARHAWETRGGRG